jgi:acetyl esterase
VDVSDDSVTRSSVPYAYNPDLVSFIESLPARTVADFENVDAARTASAAMLAPINASVETLGLVIEDRVVGDQVSIRLYAPEERERILPAILHIHGGGFIVGSIDTEYAAAVRYAKQVPAVVVSVGYRLAPEHPFPAGLEDCYAALEWLEAGADVLGVDRDRVAVVGGSAGGGLAAALALLTRDRKGPKICFQVLGMPELDDRLQTPSMQAFVDTPVWNRPLAEHSWRQYLGPEPGEVSQYAAPARATDLTMLPPAYISTMEFDPLRDEGLIYAMRLLEAGVSVELHQFAGTFHGSGMVPTADSSQRQAGEQMHVLRLALHPQKK